MNYLESLKEKGFNVDLSESQKQLYSKYVRNKRMFDSTEFEDEDEKQARLNAVEKSKQIFKNSLSKTETKEDAPEEKKSNGSIFGFIAFLGAVGIGVLLALTGNSEQKSN